MSLGLTVHLAEAPYLGLRPFEVDEADIFFGREKQTDELLRRLSQSYFLPIVGPSGCGKSSLVRAGLLASLESGFIVEAGGRWRTLAMTPRDRPIEELANAILRCLPDSEESKLIALQAVLRSGPRGLIGGLKEISRVPGENLLLLVDQFEEIFRFRDQLAPPDLVNGATSQDQRRKDEADAFVRLLLETVKEKAAYVVLTMRSDFLRDCSLFAGLPEAFNKSIYLTPRLDRDDLQSAIEEPARVLGGSLRPELVRQLINDAASNQDQLPLMQHVLMRMWSDVLKKRPNRPPELTLEDYANVGELSKALCKDADYAYEKELTTDQQKIAEVMFKSLCVRGSSERDTRAPVRVDRVAKLASLESEWAPVVPVVEVFRGEGRYFLRPHTRPLAPDTVLDITHESLIRNWTRLSKWVEEEALSAEIYQRLVRDAVEWKNRRGDLLRPIGLSSVIAWKERAKPTDSWAERYGGQFALAMEFLDASLAQQVIDVQEAARVQRQLFLKQNRIKALTALLLIAALLISGGSYLIIRNISETNRANKQTKLHEASMKEAADNYGSALAIKAQLEWRSHKLLSAWPYAVDSLAKNQNLEFGYMPPRPAIHYYRQIQHAAKVSALAISPDGKLLAAALSNGSIDLVDPQAGELVGNFAAAPSKANADRESSAASEDTSGGKRQTAQLAFSPDGKLLYCLRRESGLEIRTLADGKLLSVDKNITSFAIDSAGALALGYDDGRLIFHGDRLSNLPVMALTQSEIKAPSSQSLRPTGKSLAENIKDVAQNRRADTRSPAISFLAFASDGKRLAGVSERSLRVWQIEETQVRELKVGSYSQNFDSVPSPHISAVLFNPPADDKLMMLASEGGKIYLATLSEDTEENSPSSTRGVAAAADDRQTQSARPEVPPPSEHSPEKTFKIEIDDSLAPPKTDDLVLLKTSSADQPNKSENDEGKVVGATYPDGESLYWVTSDGSLTAWWPETLNSENETEWQRETSQLLVKAHKGAATAIALSPSGSWVATGGVDKATRIWRINTVESLARAAKETLPPIDSVAVDPRGKVVAIGSDRFGTRISHDGTIQLFRGLKPEETPVWLSDDGKSVLFYSPKTVRIFDTATFKELALVEGARSDSKIFYFAFNGAILAALESDDETESYVGLWDAETGKKLGRIRAANDKIEDLTFGSAGRHLLAIATDKNRLNIWDIHDPTHPRVAKDMSTDEANIVCISFAAAENFVAAATSDKVILFDAKTEGQRYAIPVLESPIAMSFNEKGTLLAIALKNGLVTVWDCEKNQEASEIRVPEGLSQVFVFNSDNNIVTGGSDGVVRVWDLAGQLIKSFGSDWRPKNEQDAARLSGLVREGLDVRFLTLDEEKALRINATVPLEEESLANYWRAALATTSSFKTLENKSKLRPEEVKKGDLLESWLSSHQQSSSDLGTQARAQVATDLHKRLLLNLTRESAALGKTAFWEAIKHIDIGGPSMIRSAARNGKLRDAIDIFDSVLEIIPSGANSALLALRGFARHLTGDEPGATKDRESCLREAPTLLREWAVSLRQSELASEQLDQAGKFLTWFSPNYPNGYRYQAEGNYVLKHYGHSLTEVNEAIKMQRANDAARAADEAITPAMASLLLLRGRILQAQSSPEARKDFQQVVDALAEAGIDNETKAFAELHLGKFNPNYFAEAERFFNNQTTKYPDRSLTYYNLACFFAARSASYSEKDKNARSKDVTAAIEALRKGVTLPEHDSLRRFVDTKAELLPLKKDPRFIKLLKEQEASASGDSE